MKHDHRFIPGACEASGHPLVTYNPWLNRSWCQCGERTEEDGNIVWPKPTDCGGALVECVERT